MSTILQSELLVNFLYPLLLMFFITYGVLEKTNILGSGKSQLNAGVALVVGLIFVGAVFPKIVVANLIQFMTIGLVIIFVGLMLWGFVSGSDMKSGTSVPKWAAWIIMLALFFAVIWATGLGGGLAKGISALFGWIFDSGWSSAFWTNAIFIGVIAISIAVVLKGTSNKP